MRSSILIGLLISVGGNLSFSQRARVQSIEVTGNRTIPARDLLDAMTLKISGQYSSGSLSHDEESLIQHYQHEGYVLATVNDSIAWSHDSTFVEIFLRIEEGSRAAIGHIVVSGNSILSSDDLLEHISTRAGGFINAHILEQDISSIISRYERIGYPFAKVLVQSIELLPDTTLAIGIHIDEGRKITIDEIRIAGNKETSEEVIVRETGISRHETYNEDKVAKIRERLNRMNIFSGVREPEIYQTTSGGGLLITVQEGNTNTFDGIIGYAPARSGEDQGFVTGLVNISMKNLFGTARKLSVRWQRDDSQSQELGARYVEPWLFGLPFNLGAGFFQRQQDTIYVRRTIDLKGDLMVSESFSLSGILTLENIIPSSTIAHQFVSDSRSFTTGVEVRYDSRDDIVGPTGGVLYSSGYQIGSKHITPGLVQTTDEQHTIQKISMDAELYEEAFRHQVIAFGVHGRQITGDNLELGDLYRFGGANTLRGYRENEFLGSRIAWTTAEYRFLLARRSFFFGFIDTGYFYLPSDGAVGYSSTQQFKYGYGIGIRLETSLGNAGVSIALGEGDGFGQAKLHLGLINDF